MSNIEISVTSNSFECLRVADLIYDTVYWARQDGAKKYYILINVAEVGDAILNLYDSSDSTLIKNIYSDMKFYPCNYVTISIKE